MWDGHTAMQNPAVRDARAGAAMDIAQANVATARAPKRALRS